MLEVQNFLIKWTKVSSPERALEQLNLLYGIKFTIWEDKLVVLNYCQIESPKLDAITRECRSLVLELGTWEVVSRSFDRFFNYGEEGTGEYDITKLVAHEKVDGSLIGIFYYEGEWLYRTRSVIMPDSVINGNVQGVTWKDRIEEALEEANFNTWNFTYTYIFELTCRENRVVTKYENTTGLLTLLSVRDNETGQYYRMNTAFNLFIVENGFRFPKTYSFNTIEHCMNAAKNLRDLQEGYVLYNSSQEPVMKVKNPAYVAAHRLRGNGTPTEKVILDLIIMNEVDEYLAIFPEDQGLFDPYLDACNKMCIDLDWVQGRAITWDGTQKEFALLVQDKFSKVSAMAFRMKQGKNRKESWESLTQNAKRNMILAYKEE